MRASVVKVRYLTVRGLHRGAVRIQDKRHIQHGVTAWNECLWLTRLWFKRGTVDRTECSLICAVNLGIRVQDERLPDAMEVSRKK